MPTYKVRLTASIPRRSGQSLTQAQEDEIKRRLRDTKIQDYLIDVVGWTHVDRTMDTYVQYYDV